MLSCWPLCDFLGTRTNTCSLQIEYRQQTKVMIPQRCNSANNEFIGLTHSVCEGLPGGPLVTQRYCITIRHGWGATAAAFLELLAELQAAWLARLSSPWLLLLFNSLGGVLMNLVSFRSFLRLVSFVYLLSLTCLFYLYDDTDTQQSYMLFLWVNRKSY